MNTLISIGSSALSLAAAIGIAYAAGYPGVGNQIGGSADAGPVITYAAGVAVVIQWLVFIPAYIFQTEKYYDLTGSITYITITLATLAYRLGYSNMDVRLNVRSIVCSAMVVVWALRLGSFLVKRIHRAGKDSRFDAIKPNFAAFLAAWTIQGLWVCLTLLSVLVINTTVVDRPVVWTDILGWAVWGIGFGIEIVADEQKTAFNNLRTGKWVEVGLWRYSRRARGLAPRPPPADDILTRAAPPPAQAQTPTTLARLCSGLGSGLWARPSTRAASGSLCSARSSSRCCSRRSRAYRCSRRARTRSGARTRSTNVTSARSPSSFRSQGGR